MTNQQDGKFLNTYLEGRHLTEFERVKAYHGIKTNSDVVRFLIRQEARRVAKQEAPVLTVSQPATA